MRVRPLKVLALLLSSHSSWKYGSRPSGKEEEEKEKEKKEWVQEKEEKGNEREGTTGETEKCSSRNFPFK